jgi:ribonuclease P protein component
MFFRLGAVCLKRRRRRGPVSFAFRARPAGPKSELTKSEAHVSAQQARPQAPPRVPRPQRDRRRPQGPQRAARARPQEAVGLTSPEGGARARFGRLTRRAEFQRASRGKRAQAAAFTLQAFRRPANEAEPGPRVGFTVTKKVGCAVVRNRIRRRLREAIKTLPADAAEADHDYVVLAREAALRAEFATLTEALGRAFADIRRGKSAPRRER